jgi:hypothetical protein
LSLKATFHQIAEICLCFQKQKYLTVRQSGAQGRNIFSDYFTMTYKAVHNRVGMIAVVSGRAGAVPIL